jgi:hypothetical protein
MLRVGALYRHLACSGECFRHESSASFASYCFLAGTAAVRLSVVFAVAQNAGTNQITAALALARSHCGIPGSYLHSSSVNPGPIFPRSSRGGGVKGATSLS